MKFVFYIDSLASGGAERQVYELSKSLVNSGHEVGIIINYPDYHYLEGKKKEQISIWCTKTSGRNLFKRAYSIAKILKNFSPDVVISFKASRNLEMMILSSMFKKVKHRIASIRNDSAEEMRYYGIYSKFSTMILSNSEAAKRSIEEKYGKNSKLGTIKNIINLDKFDKNIKEEKNKKVGLCLARLTDQKNQLELVKAIKKISEEPIGKNLEIRLAGHHSDSEYSNQVLKLIKKYSLEDRIKVLGERSDIKDLISQSNFVILPSKYEGFPNTVMEAMASKKIALATDVGGTGELIKDMETGILIPTPTSSDIYKGLMKYFNLQEKEKRAMIEKSYSLINNYTPDNVIKELISKILGDK